MEYWKDGRWWLSPGTEQLKTILMKQMQISFSNYREQIVLNLIKFGYLGK